MDVAPTTTSQSHRCVPAGVVPMKETPITPKKIATGKRTNPEIAILHFTDDGARRKMRLARRSVELAASAVQEGTIHSHRDQPKVSQSMYMKPLTKPTNTNQLTAPMRSTVGKGALNTSRHRIEERSRSTCHKTNSHSEVSCQDTLRHPVLPHSAFRWRLSSCPANPDQCRPTRKPL